GDDGCDRRRGGHRTRCRALLPAPLRGATAHADDDDHGVRVVVPRRGVHDLGGDPFALPYPASLRGSIEVADIVFPTYRLFVMLVAAAVGGLLWMLNERTLIGAKLRAVVDDPEMAAATGVNVSLLSGGVFAAGAGLAAFGGAMGGPILGGYAGMDLDLLPMAFVVVI